jgi:hypothetical protein
MSPVVRCHQFSLGSSQHPGKAMWLTRQRVGTQWMMAGCVGGTASSGPIISTSRQSVFREPDGMPIPGLLRCVGFCPPMVKLRATARSDPTPRDAE